MPPSVSTVRPDQLADLHPESRAYLDDLLAKGCTRPDWCLQAVDGSGRPLAHTVLWTLPGKAAPLAVVLLEADWDDTGDAAPEAGRAVLAEAAALARRLGSTELEHVVDAPAQAPQFQHRPERRAALLEASGFALARDGLRFSRRLDGELPPEHPELTFRSMRELGREPFVELLAALLADSADARLSADTAALGARGAAEQLLEEMDGLEYRPEWWELGFAPDGRAAAVSLPARNPAYPVVGFVGVGPEHRGRGYATAVVARSVRVLAGAAPGEEVRGDCDRSNPAMAAAFRRAGFERFAERAEYLLRL